MFWSIRVRRSLPYIHAAIASVQNRRSRFGLLELGYCFHRCCRDLQEIKH
ncbi:MAG TPA: hypothetical protein V6D14_16625 [Coleofasciculaceae cyanobacterium]